MVGPTSKRLFEKRWVRWISGALAVGVVMVLVAQSCWPGADDAGDVPDPPDQVYVYDAVGRLRAVSVLDGATAVYSYDAVGNISEVERYPSDSLSVIEVSPGRAAAGDTVVVHGTGFSGDADGNTVRFGDAEADVVDAEPFKLSVEMPEGAESGPASVAVGDDSADSDTELEVEVDRTPLVTGFSPSTAAPGEEVTIEGENFTGDRLLDHVVIDGASYLTVESSSETEIVASVPVTATSGRVSVATPWGTASSEEELAVEEPEEDEPPLPTLPEVPATPDSDVGIGIGDNPSGEPSDTAEADDPIASGDEDPDADLFDGPKAAVGEVVDGAASFPVDLATGQLRFEETDLAFDDLMPVAVTRSFLAVPPGPTTSQYVHAFGVGSGLEFDLRLEVGLANQWADLVLPSGLKLPFERVTDGTEREDAAFEQTGGPSELYGSQVTWNGETWDLTAEDGAVMKFGPDGELRSVQDTNGNALTIQHGRDDLGRPGQVASVHSPTGRWVSFEYDEEGRVSEAHSYLGDTAVYRYEQGESGQVAVGELIEEDLLAAVTYSAADGSEVGSVRYDYDEHYQLTGITRTHGDGGEKTVRVGYDEDGRVASQTLADGSEFTFGYEADADDVVTETVVTDPEGTVRRVSFELGLWVSDMWAEGTADEQVVAAEREPDSGFITGLEGPDGARSSYSYADGNLTEVTEAAGSDVEATTGVAYDPELLLPTEVMDPAGQSGGFAYDDAGNLVSEIGPDGSETAYGYDDRGLLTTVTDPTSNTTEIDNELSHRVTVTDSSGSTYSEFYDAAGRLVTVTDAQGDTSQLRYDSLDQVTAVVDADGAETGYDYDAAGNITALTDAEGNATTYSYNDAGLPTERTDPTGAADRYSYDDAGNLTEHVDRRGTATRFSYDVLGRLADVTFDGNDPEGDEPESTISYAYDVAGRLTEVDDSAYGVVSFGYDDAGRLLDESTPEGEISYGYDDAGRRTTMTLPDGTMVDYGYDDDTGLLGVISQGDATVSIARGQPRPHRGDRTTQRRHSRAQLQRARTAGQDQLQRRRRQPR